MRGQFRSIHEEMVWDPGKASPSPGHEFSDIAFWTIAMRSLRGLELALGNRVQQRMVGHVRYGAALCACMVARAVKAATTKQHAGTKTEKSTQSA